MSLYEDREGERSREPRRRSSAALPSAFSNYGRAALPRRLRRAFTLLSFLSSVLLVAGCGGKGGGSAPPAEFAVEVVIEKPAVMPVDDLLGAVGSMEANERVELKPEVAGLIEKIYFTEGQRVKKGDKLFDLDSQKEAASLAQTRAEEQLAKSNLERARKLEGTKAISQQDVDQLQSQLDVAIAARRVQEERLVERAIVAPLDGILGPRVVSPGQYVIAGAPLGTLVDASKVKVNFRIPERQLMQVKHGQKGRIRVSAYSERAFEGEVDLIAPEVDAATRTVGVRLIAPNAEGLLKPGMCARIELVVATRNQALVVPEAALVPSLDQFSVYTVENGVAHLRAVKIGNRLPSKAEIREGLLPGQEIVVSGTQKLVEGMKVVAAKPASTPAPITNTASGPATAASN